MVLKGSSVNRRKFMKMGSAVIASPLLLNLTGKVPEVKAELKEAIKEGEPIYFIGATCIGCQVCRMMCPESAIDFGDDRNEINQEKCVHCGTCYEECPISAITET